MPAFTFLSLFFYFLFPVFLECPLGKFFLHNSLQTSFRFHLLAPARGSSSCGGDGSTCWAPCEPPEVGLEPTGFVTPSTGALTHCCPCSTTCKGWQEVTAFLLFLGHCSLPEYFLALTGMHNGLWFASCFLGAGGTVTGHLKTFLIISLELPFFFSSHCSCHTSLMTSQVWA